jgi:hypothetical protein
MDYSLFRTPDNQETDIEDLFPEALYVQAFKITYSKELKGTTLAVSDLPQHPRIVERVNKWLESKKISLLKDGGFNHYRVAQSLIALLLPKALAEEDYKRFGALFSRVNGALN